MKAIIERSQFMMALALVMGPSPAFAQDATAPAPQTATSSTIEVTPFVAMGSNGSSPIGAAISFPVSSSFSVEAEVGYRRGEGNINALSSSANLLYALPRVGRTVPYLAAGAGLAEYGSPIALADGSIVATQPRVAFEVNAGGGLKVPVDDTWGIRTDARWFRSFGRDASEHWRVSQGISFDVGKR
jgi:hypothetical protein